MWGKKKLRESVRGTARVVSSSRAFTKAMYIPLRMTLVVEVPGIATTSLEYRQKMARTAKLPVPGQIIPVEVDRTDPTRVRVLWDEVPVRVEQSRRQGQALAASIRGERDAADVPPGGDTNVPAEAAGVVEEIRRAFPGATVNIGGSAAFADSVSAGQDRVSQLERLAKLRDTGVLTPEEFAAEKARVLGRDGG